MSDRPPSAADTRRLMGSRPRHSEPQQNCPELRELRDAAYNDAHAQVTAARQQRGLTTRGNAFSATLGRRERALYIERLEPRFVALAAENTRLRDLTTAQEQRLRQVPAHVAAECERAAAAAAVAATDAAAHDIETRDHQMYELTTRLQAAQLAVSDAKADKRALEADKRRLQQDLERERALRKTAEGLRQVAEHYLPASTGVASSTATAGGPMPAILSTLPSPPLSPMPVVDHAPAAVPAPSVSPPMDWPGDFVDIEAFFMTRDGVPAVAPELPGGSVVVDNGAPAPGATVPSESDHVPTTAAASAATAATAAAAAATVAAPAVAGPTPVRADRFATPAAAVPMPPPVPAPVSMQLAPPVPPRAHYSPVTPHHGALAPFDAVGAGDQLFPPSSHFPSGLGD